MFENFNFFNDFLGDEYFNRYFNPSLKRIRFTFDEPNPNEIPTGDVKITTGENESGTWEKREWISPDGSSKMSTYVYTNKNSKSINDKKLLKDKIKKAVSEEDYETAAKLKKELENFDSKVETNVDNVVEEKPTKKTRVSKKDTK